jgi:hypothetical protein
MPLTPCDAIVPSLRDLHVRGPTPSRTGLLGCVAVVGLVAGFVVPPMMPRHGCMAHDQVARLTVDMLAFERYPQWLLDHPARVCPTSLLELAPERDWRDFVDPWGTPLKFACRAGSFVVRSAGEDARFGTADDIRSDR